MKECTPEQLCSFLVRAKVATYASGGEPTILSDGSKELAFEENQFKYRDRYFGSDPFVGEEIVVYNGQVVWAMNYYGAVCRETGSAHEVYKFLMKALTQVEQDRPFRGPVYLREQEWEYRDESQGNIERFVGKERILYLGEQVYELVYHGGTVK